MNVKNQRSIAGSDTGMRCSRFWAGLLLATGALTSLLAGCGGDKAATPTTAVGDDPPEVTVGERLFLETRFAEFFAEHAGGDMNRPLAGGDPALAVLPNIAGDLSGPFRAQSMNCRQCHLVDEGFGKPGGGNRTYSDFARRSVLTDRGDEPALTVRNSPALVDSTLPRAGAFILHGDGEFTSITDLARATIAGRMGGWLPQEHAAAIAHIARVIREDDGSGALAADQGGGSYRAVLAGTQPGLPLAQPFRLNVDSATDDQIVDDIARLIGAYVDSLRFQVSADGLNIGAPFDLFLGLNGLPATPAVTETDLDYARRLRTQLDALAAPKLVAPDVLRRFQFHAQPFQFGEAELRGLRVFLREPASAAGLSAAELAGGGVGNCVSCHAPPKFTDFGLHNTGITQREYDGIHGAGAFAGMPVPSLAERADPTIAQALLPKTLAHPDYQGLMRAIPSASDPRRVDLGSWNIFADGDYPQSQTAVRRLLCNIVEGDSTIAACAAIGDDALLDRAVATFKTPSLRDLADSQPYMHDGTLDTLDDVTAFYAQTSAQARDGTSRNADPRLRNISINAQDQADLAAFLRALNEDYS